MDEKFFGKALAVFGAPMFLIGMALGGHCVYSFNRHFLMSSIANQAYFCKSRTTSLKLSSPYTKNIGVT